MCSSFNITSVYLSWWATSCLRLSASSFVIGQRKSTALPLSLPLSFSHIHLLTKPITTQSYRSVLRSFCCLSELRIESSLICCVEVNGLHNFLDHKHLRWIVQLQSVKLQTRHTSLQHNLNPNPDLWNDLVLRVAGFGLLCEFYAQLSEGQDLF